MSNQGKGRNYGIDTFVAPAAPLPALVAAPAEVAITNSAEITSDGVTYLYATLDNSSPDDAALGCSSTPAVIPSGWSIAENNPDTQSNIKALAKPWGTASLVLADGTRISPADGTYQDGAQTYVNSLIEKMFDGGVYGYRYGAHPPHHTPPRCPSVAPYNQHPVFVRPDTNFCCCSADCTSKPATNKRILLVQQTGVKISTTSTSSTAGYPGTTTTTTGDGSVSGNNSGDNSGGNSGKGDSGGNTSDNSGKTVPNSAATVTLSVLLSVVAIVALLF